METTTKYKSNVEIYPDPESVAQNTVRIFVADAQKAIKARGTFYVAISGGNTPKRFFELLGEAPQASSLPWEKVQLFWVDERYVRPDSQWSNYKLAVDTFLTRVAIPDANVHRIPTEDEDVKVAAHRYEQTIREVFGLGAGNVVALSPAVSAKSRVLVSVQRQKDQAHGGGVSNDHAGS